MRRARRNRIDHHGGEIERLRYEIGAVNSGSEAELNKRFDINEYPSFYLFSSKWEVLAKYLNTSRNIIKSSVGVFLISFGSPHARCTMHAAPP